LLISITNEAFLLNIQKNNLSGSHYGTTPTMEISWVLRSESILPLSAPAKRFRFARHIKTLSQRIMTTYRLLIAIEHALPNWPIVEEEGVSPFPNPFDQKGDLKLSSHYWAPYSRIEDYGLKVRITATAHRERDLSAIRWSELGNQLF
jgi:hypothetical protein